MASVLLIDAEKEFAQPITQAMKGWGYQVEWVTDGKDGLDRAVANAPTAIVLCVELPKMSGYSICNKLKKDDALKNIPLIITSREATPETFEQHKKLKTRAEAYLIKPFKAADLQPLLRQYAPNGDVETAPVALKETESEEDIVLDDIPAATKTDFDPGALVGDESKEEDPFGALDGLDIGSEPELEHEREATRIMKMPIIVPPAKVEAKSAVDAKATATKPAAAKPATTTTAPRVVTTSAKPVSDDERKQLEQKLQEAKNRAAQAAQDVDKLRAEMNQLRTKSREETAQLRTQVQELTEKIKTEQQTLKARYEDATQKAVKEAVALRQQVKDVQARAQGELEQLRGQLIEMRNQSQDLLAQKDQDVAGSKSRMSQLETEVEMLRSETSRSSKIRERTQKAVDVALQLLEEQEQNEEVDNQTA